MSETATWLTRESIVDPESDVDDTCLTISEIAGKIAVSEAWSDQISRDPTDHSMMDESTRYPDPTPHDPVGEYLKDVGAEDDPYMGD